MVTSVIQCIPGAVAGPTPVPLAGWATGHWDLWLGAAELRSSGNGDSCAGEQQQGSASVPQTGSALAFFLTFVRVTDPSLSPMSSPPTLTMEHMALSWLLWDVQCFLGTVQLPMFDWATEGGFGLGKCPGKCQAPLLWIYCSDPTAIHSKSTWYSVERAQVTIE